ncbi:hypothetical protein [Bradyrhizobium sp. USDA 4350]
MFDREMMAALAADAAKLEQLTGEDHTPEFLADCQACGGEGSIDVWESVGKWSIDPPSARAVKCEACNGVGFFVVEAAACEKCGDTGWRRFGPGALDLEPCGCPADLGARVDEDDCPGHVASDADPKVCGRCGVHIDSLRPPGEE